MNEQSEQKEKRKLTGGAWALRALATLIAAAGIISILHLVLGKNEAGEHYLLSTADGIVNQYTVRLVITFVLVGICLWCRAAFNDPEKYIGWFRRFLDGIRSDASETDDPYRVIYVYRDPNGAGYTYSKKEPSFGAGSPILCIGRLNSTTYLRNAWRWTLSWELNHFGERVLLLKSDAGDCLVVCTEKELDKWLDRLDKRKAWDEANPDERDGDEPSMPTAEELVPFEVFLVMYQVSVVAAYQPAIETGMDAEKFRIGLARALHSLVVDIKEPRTNHVEDKIAEVLGLDIATVRKDRVVPEGAGLRLVTKPGGGDQEVLGRAGHESTHV